MGGNRWWLGHLGDRGRLLWPSEEPRSPRCLHIPESTRAESGGTSVLESLEAHLYWRAEAEKVSGIQKETMCGLDSVFAFPGGPEEVPAFSPAASVEQEAQGKGWNRKRGGLRLSPECRAAAVPVLGRSSLTCSLTHSPHTLLPPSHSLQSILLVGFLSQSH